MNSIAGASWVRIVGLEAVEEADPTEVADVERCIPWVEEYGDNRPGD